MVYHPNSSEISVDQVLVKAMGACLRFMLQDIMTQYKHAVDEMKRIEKSGVAVTRIYREFNGDGKELDHENDQPYPRQYPSPTKVRPTAGRYVPDAHPAQAAATPVAPEAAYQKTNDNASFRGAR